jgi:hypothetical protein
MTDSSNPQSNLGERIGAWLDTSTIVPVRESSEANLRQAVIAGVQRRQRNRRRLGVTASAVSVFLVAVVGLGIWKSAPASSVIQFHLLPGNGLGQVGAYVAPTVNSPLELKFSEGSVVELEPGARARVAATTAKGATVLLETGRADVDVVHRNNAEWTIMAGPYSVRVHGTSFSVEFDPKSQLFELVMRSGVVTVEGPGISQPVEIRGAQRFVHRAGLGFDGGDNALRGESDRNHKSDINGVEFESTSPVASTLGAVAAKPNAAKSPVEKAPTASSWETQVRRGEYRAVLRDAEARGLPLVLSTAGSSELLALANAARFSGRIDVGRDAYKAIRQRFSSTSSSASAAFLLGRLTEGPSPLEAKRWYERYEQEAPNGALVAEAMGRRLVLTQTTGNRVEVQRLADDYLRRFPDGPYAGVARKIVAP